MKKIYICPGMKIVALRRKHSLLTTSPLNIKNENASTSGEYYNDAPKYSDSDDFDFE